MTSYTRFDLSIFKTLRYCITIIINQSNIMRIEMCWVARWLILQLQSSILLWIRKFINGLDKLDDLIWIEHFATSYLMLLHKLIVQLEEQKFALIHRLWLLHWFSFVFWNVLILLVFQCSIIVLTNNRSFWWVHQKFEQVDAWRAALLPGFVDVSSENKSSLLIALVHVVVEFFLIQQGRPCQQKWFSSKVALDGLHPLELQPDTVYEQNFPGQLAKVRGGVS